MKLTSSLYLDADVDILGRISWQAPSDRIVDIRKCYSYLHERTSLERKLEFERLRATTELLDVRNGDFKQERRTENAERDNTV